MPTTIGSITLNGSLSDRTSADRLDAIYGKYVSGSTGAAYYVFRY